MYSFIFLAKLFDAHLCTLFAYYLFQCSVPIACRKLYIIHEGDNLIKEGLHLDSFSLYQPTLATN